MCLYILTSGQYVISSIIKKMSYPRKKCHVLPSAFCTSGINCVSQYIFQVQYKSLNNIPYACCLLCKRIMLSTLLELHLILTFEIYSCTEPHKLSLNSIINFLLTSLSDMRCHGSRVYGYTLETTALRKQRWIINIESSSPARSIDTAMKDEYTTPNVVKECMQENFKT